MVLSSSNNKKKQESIPVRCVPPALYHTGRSLLGVSLTETSPDRDPLDRDPARDRRSPGQRLYSWTKTTLLDRDSTPGQRLYFWTETPLDRDPPEGTWDQGQRPDQAARQTGSDIKDSPPPVNRMTHASENITLPQTSFAGGKNFPSHIKSFCDICVVWMARFR